MSDKTVTTTALLAGELSTQSFSDKHPDVAEQWVNRIWNAALDAALEMSQLHSVEDEDIEALKRNTK